MSGGALFGNSASRGGSKNLVEVKAGKMTMKGNMVYPDNRKGKLFIYQSNDSLRHFCWKDRTTFIIEDDLIIFPDDCEFKHVPQCKTGRVYVLRFKSSNKKFFVWLQDLNTDKDEEHCRKINEVLNNPPTSGSQRCEGDMQKLIRSMPQQQLMQLFGGVGQIGGLGSLLGTMNRSHVHSSSRASTTSASTPVTTSVARPPATQTPAPAAAPAAAAVTETPNPSAGTTPATPVTSSSSSSSSSGNAGNKIQLSDLQNFLSEMRTRAEAVVQSGVASELTNGIPGEISVTESLERAVSAHLPPGDNLSGTLSSPQFAQALSMFWSALQSGQAGPVISQFGLGEDAVNAAASGDIEEFVSAVQSEVNALQSEAKGSRPGQQEEKSKAASQASPEKKPEKKNDDDEDMSLD